MILLVHSCNSREWIKPYWMRFFEKSGWDIKVQWITGSEPFTTQLIKTLESLDYEYFFYMLDDFFMTKKAQAMPKYTYLDFAKKHKMDALRLQPGVQFNSIPYRFEWMDGLPGNVLKQIPTSEYKISLQASIWRREYFLECLTPGLDPWQLEKSDCELGDVYFWPTLSRWYIDATLKGVLSDNAKKMIND